MQINDRIIFQQGRKQLGKNAIAFIAIISILSIGAIGKIAKLTNIINHDKGIFSFIAKIGIFGKGYLDVLVMVVLAVIFLIGLLQIVLRKDILIKRGGKIFILSKKPFSKYAEIEVIGRDIEGLYYNDVNGGSVYMHNKSGNHIDFCSCLTSVDADEFKRMLKYEIAQQGDAPESRT